MVLSAMEDLDDKLGTISATTLKLWARIMDRKIFFCLMHFRDRTVHNEVKPRGGRKAGAASSVWMTEE